MADMNIHVNDVAAEQAPAIKSQMNPIFPIDVAILKNTNFFRAFTTSSMILAIYIQQFWDTMCFDSSTGLYSCQLDEQWFNIHKDILREALDINPTNDDNPFVASPSSDTVIEYVNTLGYPSTLRNVSAISFEEESSSGFTRKEEDRSSAYLKYVGKDGREIFGMPIPDALLTDEIKGAPCFSGYLEHVADYQCYLDEEHNKVEEEEAENPDEPSPTKRSKGGLVGKRRNPKSPPRLVDEPSNEGVPVEEPAYNEEEVNIQLALELSLPNQGERTQGPARPVVIMEPNSGRLQPLPEVQGKGKDKVVEEQATHDLLTLQTPKKKSPAD
ncbi:retrovirus-related pol polyprotein from transposon TNT 1-94 [Tanacetum coccineum]